MIENKILDVSRLKIFVLDEADEMLSQGFKEVIEEINHYLPKNAQTVLLSATVPNEILEMTEKILENPVKILVPRDELTLDGLKQYYIAVDKDENKMDTLLDLYETLSISQCVIFCNKKSRVD